MDQRGAWSYSSPVPAHVRDSMGVVDEKGGEGEASDYLSR